jgi:hypothetical protein
LEALPNSFDTKITNIEIKTSPKPLGSLHNIIALENDEKSSDELNIVPRKVKAATRTISSKNKQDDSDYDINSEFTSSDEAGSIIVTSKIHLYHLKQYLRAILL